MTIRFQKSQDHCQRIINAKNQNFECFDMRRLSPFETIHKRLAFENRIFQVILKLIESIRELSEKRCETVRNHHVEKSPA